MFFSHHKENALAWESRARELESQVSRLETDLEREVQARRSAEAQATELEVEIDKCRRIYQTMGEFATSFVDIQRSQLAIANAMKAEKQSAIEAASMSGTNQAAMEKISSNLQAMSNDTGEMAGKVGGPLVGFWHS